MTKYISIFFQESQSSSAENAVTSTAPEETTSEEPNFDYESDTESLPSTI